MASTTPARRAFYLKNSNSHGNADVSFTFGTAGNWIPIVGDWDGDGKDTVGFYDPTTTRFYLKNSNSHGNADVSFTFGMAGNWIPVVGDWDGDGTDTIGLYDPSTTRFYLKNSNSHGNADVSFTFGTAGNWIPIVGDWDGDGKDTVGFYDPSTTRFYLKNSNSHGNADISFTFGMAGNWKPIAGDWNGDGTDTVGLYDPAAPRFYLKNSNSHGNADISFSYGMAGNWIPIVGDWGSAALLAANQVVASANTPALTQAELQPIVNAAIARWSSAGLNAATVQKLTQVQFVISDLSGSYLGETEGNRVYIDVNAAGNGWFVDPTPASDEEFASSGSQQQLTAVDPRALDRIDLLTVVEHELGHVAGLSDIYAVTDDIMNGVLGTGIRRDIVHTDAMLAS